MTRRSRWIHLATFIVSFALAGPALAGAVELSLDRGSILALLDASVPRRLAVQVPGVGEVALEVGGPEDVVLRDGGIELDLQLNLRPLGVGAIARVRLEPEVERTTGTVRLVTRELSVGRGLPVALEPSRIVPPVELPRRVGGVVAGPGDRDLEVDCFVQNVRIDEERLVVELGLVVRSASGP
jgi:hypothetical protein